MRWNNVQIISGQLSPCLVCYYPQLAPGEAGDQAGADQWTLLQSVSPDDNRSQDTGLTSSLTSYLQSKDGQPKVRIMAGHVLHRSMTCLWRNVFKVLQFPEFPFKVSMIHNPGHHSQRHRVMASEPWASLSHKLLLRRVTVVTLSDYPPPVKTNCCKFGRCAWLTVRETQAESTCNILPDPYAQGIMSSLVGVQLVLRRELWFIVI